MVAALLDGFGVGVRRAAIAMALVGGCAAADCAAPRLWSSGHALRVLRRPWILVRVQLLRAWLVHSLPGLAAPTSHQQGRRCM